MLSPRSYWSRPLLIFKNRCTQNILYSHSNSLICFIPRSHCYSDFCTTTYPIFRVFWVFKSWTQRIFFIVCAWEIGCTCKFVDDIAVWKKKETKRVGLFTSVVYSLGMWLYGLRFWVMHQHFRKGSEFIKKSSFVICNWCKNFWGFSWFWDSGFLAESVKLIF